VLALELIDEVIHQAVVKIFTTQMGVTSRALDFEDTFFNCEEGDIEGTATEIENEDVALAGGLLVKTVCDGGGSGFVDDSENVQAGNETSVLGRLALGVVEVGWNSDDGVVDGASEVGLSSLPHLGQDHGADLLGGESLHLSLELDFDDGLASLVKNLEREVLDIGLNLGVSELSSDQTLRIEDCVCWVERHLILGRISDQSLSVGESDEAGCGSVALVVGNNFDAVISEDTDARVGR
jgi:NAD-specific glutamate dehydrogenase